MGNASKPYPHVHTPRDYNIPNNDGIVLPNPKKGVLYISHIHMMCILTTYLQMSMNSNSDCMPPAIIWTINSENSSTPLEPVNDEGAYWSITLTQPELFTLSHAFLDMESRVSLGPQIKCTWNK
jgi:hypothetical protein